MKPSHSLQQRTSLLLWLVVSSMLLSIALGGVWFYQIAERIGNTARQQTSDLIALEESFSDAVGSLADQTQEWKDSLLRAHDPALFARHQKDFQLHAQALQDRLARTRKLMQAMGLSTANIERFQRDHQTLLRQYQDALGALDTGQALSFRTVDERVRGADRALLADLKAQHRALEKDVALRVAALGMPGAPSFSSNLIAVGALAVLLPLIGLLAFLAALRALRQLGRDDRHARAIYEAIGDAILVTDAQGRVQSLNARAQSLLGWPLVEALGKPLAEVFELFDSSRQRRVESPVDVVLRERKTLPLANGMQLRRRDGSFLAIEDSAAPVLDAAGKLIGVVMVFHDVTRQQQTLRLLRESEERQRLTLQWAADAVFICAPDGPIDYVNEAVTEALGYSRDELIRMTVYDLVPAAWREQYRQIASAALQTDSHQVFEIRLIRKDGSTIPMELNMVRLPDGRVYGSCRDLTERKRAEKIQQQQVKFIKALNGLAEVIAGNDQTSSLLEATVKLIGETMAADRALIYDISFEQRQIKGLSEWLNPRHPDISSTLATYALETFIGGASEMLRTHHYQVSHADAINPCLLGDGSAELLHHKMMIQSALWYPFDFRPQSYHLLVLNQVHTRCTWSTEELAFIAAVCQQLSVALNKLKMLDEQRLAAENLRIAACAFESQQGSIVTDTKCVMLKVNQAFTRITGYSAEEAIGQNSRLLSSGRHNASFYAAMWDSIGQTGGWQGEIWNRRKDGNAFPEWLSISAVADPDGKVTHYVGSFTDLTESKSAEDRIKQLAFYDSLTGLPNRQLLLDRLAQARAASARSQHLGALLLLDLDNFKILNETAGSLQGDLLLTQVAQRLTTCIREGDTLARLGSDEFVVLLEELGDDAFVASERIQGVGQKILVALNQVYQLGSITYHGSASAGVTLFGATLGEAADEPLKRAELAMYQAKKAGRNTLRFFETKMQVAVLSHAALEADLGEALLQGQLVLYYQAQVIGNGHVTGAEALVRWQHPLRGLVPPAEFIPLAEETGLILPLGRWVLEAACMQLALWAAQPALADLKLAVNVSARQMHQKDFVEQVLAVLVDTGANPRRLKLELTESLLADDLEGIFAKMTRLKAQGVGFSLDDFGTGYSSLSYLKRLPLDQLKIDQSFVRNILTDSNDAAIAKMVIALAGSLGLEVIAEGVETQPQREFLARLGCAAYQGYLFSRPLPVAGFQAYAEQMAGSMGCTPC